VKEGIMFKSEGKKIKVRAFETEYDAEVQIVLYHNGNTAVVLYTEHEPLCSLSVNTEKILPTGHFYLKEWSENLEIAHNQSVQEIIKECGQHEDYASGYVVARCFTIS
jgi:hypothetical protein